jgi:acetyl-CoA acyltransferase
VHDCFAVTELLMIEALGFCGRGEAKKLLRAGDTALAGRIPVNPGGGLLAFGHPVGATGVKQAFEIFRQMKGRCADYQIKTPPKVGVAANMGGDDRTAVVSVFRDAG